MIRYSLDHKRQPKPVVTEVTNKTLSRNGTQLASSAATPMPTEKDKTDRKRGTNKANRDFTGLDPASQRTLYYATVEQIAKLTGSAQKMRAVLKDRNNLCSLPNVMTVVTTCDKDKIRSGRLSKRQLFSSENVSHGGLQPAGAVEPTQRSPEGSSRRSVLCLMPSPGTEAAMLRRVAHSKARGDPARRAQGYEYPYNADDTYHTTRGAVDDDKHAIDFLKSLRPLKKRRTRTAGESADLAG